ncbi:MAG: hypothetical protein ACRC8W_09355 [Plesiomonas shigelloides]
MIKDSICFKCKHMGDCEFWSNEEESAGVEISVNHCDEFETKQGMCRDCHEVHELNNGLCMYCEMEERRMEIKAIMLAVMVIVVFLAIKFFVE